MTEINDSKLVDFTLTLKFCADLGNHPNITDDNLVGIKGFATESGLYVISAADKQGFAADGYEYVTPIGNQEFASNALVDAARPLYEFAKSEGYITD